jgi:membrane-associated phospholipid phosphatase
MILYPFPISPRRNPRHRAIVGLWCILALPLAHAERLSDWLLRNQTASSYLPGLQWQVPAEQAPQENLRRFIVQGLQDHAAPSWAESDRQTLVDWLRALPLTGRLTIALPDARWLQSAPDQDPVLLDSHRVVLGPRPQTVTVLSSSGLPCAANHSPGAHITDYLRACLAERSGAVDEVWLVQPDGRSTRYGIASWNSQPQDEPAPGAWLWAPTWQAAVPFATSDALARFLATQLPGELTWPSLHVPDRRVGVDASPHPLPLPARLTASDWGEIGLLQTPTARMKEAGAVRVNVTAASPYTRVNTMLQPLDWLEAGFRYIDINNQLYGPAIAGDQTLKDKSLDVKVRLAQESRFWPEVAVGIRDLGGTGLFSSEYVVASKRTGSLDWSLGLGWGNLGARGNITNPLSVLDNRFNTRPASSLGQGGTVDGGAYMRGPAAMFGGVQWQTPNPDLIAKVEWDGNDYQKEPFATTLSVKSPINLGLVYRFNPNVDFSMGLLRGERISFGFTLHGDLGQLQSPKLLDPKPVGVSALAPPVIPVLGWDGTAADIARYTGWEVRAIDHQPQSTRLVVETQSDVHVQDRIERTLRILHRDAPASSRTLIITLRQHGLALSHLEVDRAEWVAQRLSPQPPSLRLPAGQMYAAPLPQATQPVPLLKGKAAGFNMEVGPSFSQILGGPNAFVLYQAGLRSSLDYRFTDRTWLHGSLNARLLDNYVGFTYDAPSELPRVRTNQREYVTTARFTVPVMQLTHVQDLGSGHYASFYGGMLESMYGGIGGEWLYRPWHGPIAVGVDINRVQQRGFSQDFSFRDYTTTTGHATVYWDTGWSGVQVQLSAGRYLAEDVGATLDIKRTFPNGVALGAYATKTNVSAEQFGEGSFDKGIYLTIPFDVLLPRSTPGVGTIAWSPLTRDGGAKLSRRFPLYDLTNLRDRRTLQWAPVQSAQPQSAENTSYLPQGPAVHLMDNLGGTTHRLGQQLAEVPGSSWLWAGGAVLAASLLDKSVDNWAQDQTTNANLEKLAKASNAVPLAMALGTGLLYTGVAGEASAHTAQIAVKAAAYTLAGNLVTRWVVGRARPYEDLGPGQFNGLRPEAVGSGFASNHVALAFALATPYAQRHDMPWLYAVAASTALGRVQPREHWLSDTVAGGLMGYTIGTLLSQQETGQKGPRWSVTPQSVQAQWHFN